MRGAGSPPGHPDQGRARESDRLPLIEAATRFNPRIQRHTQEYRDLYRRRVAVEREFGRLKHDDALTPLRARGLARIQLHADLVMLARLTLALSRARAIPLAA